jgi:predicted O-methyltransferase YrrM
MINRILYKLFYRIHDLALRPHILSAIGKLNSEPQPEAHKLAACLTETFSSILTPEESDAVQLLESIRTRLECSNERILMTDYGAQAKNSAEQIARVVGDVAVQSSKPYRWALFLFKLIRTFKPASCLELGTCLGVSGMYQASALRLNGKGSLVTLEGAESYAAIAKETFSSAGFPDIQIVVGRFQETLFVAAAQIAPIDLVFIDGHHDGDATLRYFETLLPFCSAAAIVVFDDIHWSRGMTRAWNVLRTDSRIAFFSDLSQVGIIFLRPKR